MESTSSTQAGPALGINVGVRGRKGVQQDDVSRSADAILAAGNGPTVERVRAHLVTGSPNTVTHARSLVQGPLGSSRRYGPRASKRRSAAGGAERVSPVVGYGPGRGTKLERARHAGCA